MIEEQRKQITEYRKQGFGYKSIAMVVGLSRESVRAFCKRNGLDGYGKELKKEVVQETSYPSGYCRNCGKPINQGNHHGRPRVYCSKECKLAWERGHTRKYEHICYYCGKYFENSCKNAFFCSHNCYVRHKFYRNEDLERIIASLKMGKSIKNIPGWVKDLILGMEERKGDI